MMNIYFVFSVAREHSFTYFDNILMPSPQKEMVH